LRTPRTQEWHVGLDRAFGSHQRLSVAYVGAAGRDLTYAYTYYVDQAHLVHAVTSDGTSDYHALLVEFVRQTARHIDGRITYTWSHAIDLDSGEATDRNLPPMVAAPQTNRGSADFDRRHNLRASVSYRVPAIRAPQLVRRLLENWQCDLVGVLTSGAPVTVTTAQNLANGTYQVRPDAIAGQPLWLEDPHSPTGHIINVDAFRPPAGSQGQFGRNTLHASSLRQLDVRVSRTFHVAGRFSAQWRLDAFNALNVPNFAPPDTALNSTSFGRPVQTYAEGLGTGTLSHGGLVPLQQVGGPRSLELGVRVSW
jgi:hypothetical protein